LAVQLLILLLLLLLLLLLSDFYLTFLVYYPAMLPKDKSLGWDVVKQVFTGSFPFP